MITQEKTDQQYPNKPKSDKDKKTQKEIETLTLSGLDPNKKKKL